MTDPIILLARQRIIKLSADLEVQLADKNGGGVAIEILHRLQRNAAESLAALAFIDFFDPAERKKIPTLQAEVRKYDEWIEHIKAIIAEGISEDKRMRDSERDELIDVLLETPEGEREAIELGLIDPTAD